jgi:hypothetical protein
MASELELGVDEPLPGGDLSLLEQRDRRLGERLERNVEERRPADEPERTAEQLNALARGGASGFLEKVLEPEHVDLLGSNIEHVAGWTRDDHPVAEEATELRHDVLERRTRGARCALAPEVVDESLARHRLPRADRERAEQRPLLPPREPHEPLALPDLEWPQQAELEHRPGCSTQSGVTSRQPGVVRRPRNADDARDARSSSAVGAPAPGRRVCARNRCPPRACGVLRSEREDRVRQHARRRRGDLRDGA